MARVLSTATAAIIVALACGRTEEDAASASSNIVRCYSNSDCSAGACLCGACSVPCSAASDCSASGESTCFPTSEIPGCASPPSANICLQSCSTIACDVGFACRDGACLPEAIPLSEGGAAGMPAAPSSSGGSLISPTSGGTHSGGTIATAPEHGGAGAAGSLSWEAGGNAGGAAGAASAGGASGSGEPSSPPEGGAATQPSCDPAPVLPECRGSAAERAGYHLLSLGYLSTGPFEHVNNQALARAINEAGVVVGTSDSCDNNIGWVFQNGVMQRLTPLHASSYSFPLDINDANVILGASDEQVAVWRYGVPERLQGLPSRFDWEPVAINNSEQVLLSTRYREADSIAGECLPLGLEPGACATAFIWQDGALREIPFDAPNAGMRPMAMNNLGQVVGQIYFRALHGISNEHRAFFFDGIATHLLPGLHSDEGFAMGLDDFGNIVGRSGDRAVLWSAGEVIDITPDTGHAILHAEAWAITNSGTVLARFRDEASVSNGAPYLYRNGEFTFFETDANDGWGFSINSRNEIAGIRRKPGTIYIEAVVWSPQCFATCCDGDSSN